MRLYSPLGFDIVPIDSRSVSGRPHALKFHKTAPTLPSTCCCIALHTRPTMAVQSHGAASVARVMLLLALCAAAAAQSNPSRGGTPRAPTLKLTADVPWIVQYPDLPAVSLALRDVSHDWYKVLGVQPLRLASLPTTWHGGPIIVFDTDDSLPAEQFTITVASHDTSANYTLVHVTGSTAPGSSNRGCIYAAYHFAEAVLGVDPWYYFYDVGPAYSGSLALDSSYSYNSGVPAFERRGWFPNDEDMSGGFFADPLGQSVYTVSSFNRMLETLLRLRGNTIIVGTTGFPDENTFTLAARRGVMIAEHHMTPLGLNVWGWPTGLSYSYRLNPDIFRDAWKALVEFQQDRDMLWSVGFRGLWDEPFWVVDPAVSTDKQRGQMIQEVLGNQTAIIEQVTGKPGRYFIYMWSQMLNLLEGGYLKVPDDVTIVWADDGTGIIKGKAMAKEGQVRHNGAASTDLTIVLGAQGLYYHVMMMDDIANQLTEAVPPHRIFSEIGYMYSKGAVNYTIINVSDVRPVPLSLEAIMRFLWDPAPYVSQPPWQAQQTFLVDWCTRHIGATVASELADVYGRYFNISYMADDTAPLRYGDRYLATWGQELAQMFQMDVNGTAPINNTFVNRAVKFVDGPLAYTADLLYNRTLPLQARVPQAGLPMFLGHTVLQVGIHYHGLSTLSQLSSAMLAYLKGDRTTAVAQTKAAIASLDALLALERSGEGTGRWQGLFQYDQFDDFGWSRQLFLSTLRSLEGQAAAVVPNQPFYANLFTYECARFAETGCANFPFMYPRSDSLAGAVRATCAGDPHPPSPQRVSVGTAVSCANTWTGGLFTGASAGVVLESAAPASAGWVIRYTTDGSAPGPASPEYRPGTPVVVTGNTTIRAASFAGDGSLVSAVTSAEFDRR